MTEDLKQLFQKVSFLTEDQKSMYLHILERLGDDEKTRFMAIIQEAVEKEASLKNAAATEKSDAIKGFLSELDEFMQESMKSAKDSEEKSEGLAADKILDNL